MSTANTRPNQYPDFIFKASSGFVEGVTPLFKFGFNAVIDTGTTPEDIISLGGTKLFPTASSTLSIVSTSANDAFPSGTGVRNVRIFGLDSDYNQIQEDVELDGLTPVISSLSYFRVFRMYSISGGSNESAVGDIIVTHDEGDIIEIPNDFGQTHDCSYTVPDNHLLVIGEFKMAIERTQQGATADGHFDIMVEGSSVWRELIALNVNASGSSISIKKRDPWFCVAERTDVKIHVHNVSNNNTFIAASFDGFLIDLGKFQW